MAARRERRRVVAAPASTASNHSRPVFLLRHALLDVSIALWDCKVAFDNVRPVAAIGFLFGGQLIEAWAGPYQGTRLIPAGLFRSCVATPPFAECTSGHIAFGSAAARMLQSVTGSPRFNATDTFPRVALASSPVPRPPPS